MKLLDDNFLEITLSALRHTPPYYDDSGLVLSSPREIIINIWGQIRNEYVV